MTIDGAELVVWSDQVDKPVEIMYAWTRQPVLTLGSKDGLLAFPFYLRDGKPVSLYSQEAFQRSRRYAR